MRFSAFVLTIFATTALGVPTVSVFSPSDSRLHVRDTLDQGDGFYLAVTDVSNKTTVEFTPFTELEKAKLLKSPAKAPKSLVARGTSCFNGKTRDLPALDEANRMLARNADAQHWYGQRTWGWVSES